MMSGEICPLRRLDLRTLDPPEPLRQALEAVEALAAGETVEVLTDREPLFLHLELARRKYFFEGEARPDGFSTTVRRSLAGGEAP